LYEQERVARDRAHQQEIDSIRREYKDHSSSDRADKGKRRM
jgi:hypothetical protein